MKKRKNYKNVVVIREKHPHQKEHLYILNILILVLVITHTTKKKD